MSSRADGRTVEGVQWYEPVAPRGDLDHALACVWTARPTGRHRLVPDACVDVLRLSTGEMWICGPEVRAWTFELPAGVTAVGARFRPGVAPIALGVDAGAIANRRMRWAEVFGAQAEDEASTRLGDPSNDADRLRVMQDVAADLLRDRTVPDPAAEAVLIHLDRRPGARAAEIAAVVGLTPRQLHRRSVASFGYGVATLARILRFHRLWSLVAADPAGDRCDDTGRCDHPHGGSVSGLAALAAAAGYSDQAHMSRDCRAITGLTPRRFFAEAFPTFPDMSDPFKTRSSGAGMLGR